MEAHETGCLLCGSRADLRHYEYPGYQEPDTFRIYHCPSCNTAFSLPRKESSVIYENIYRNGDKVPGYSRYWRYARIIKRVPVPLDFLAESHEDYWSVRESLSLYVNDRPSTKILEVGSGLGYLTYSLHKAGYNITGMDISQTAIRQAIHNFGDHYICKDLFEFSVSSPGSFDIVILTEVIEHVNNPVEFLNAIIRLLKPGGRAIITTPNKSFYPDKTIWASDLPPVHCWWLSEDSMTYIAGRLKADVSFISFEPYYKMNYQSISIHSLLDNHLPKPFFNSRGELIKEVRSKGSFKSDLQMTLIKLPILHRIYRYMKKNLKRIYGKLKVLFNPNVIVCRERGYILCCVMHKPANN